MADDHEISTKLDERQIPVFTVFKNDCILKNIYLLDNPPSPSPPPSATPENDAQEDETLETLWVGRHPDCNIRLEHPSISRFHLKIHSNPSSRSLSITDLNSVHGTWISGKKVDPFVTTELNEGDALQLGGSSRLYRLHWVPYSRAYDLEDPFVPQLDAQEIEEEEETEDPTIFQNESSLLSQNKQVRQISSDSLEGLELLFSNENLCSPVQESSLSTPLVSKNLYDSLFDEEALQNRSSPCGMYGHENKISSNQFEEESSTPQAFCHSSVHQTVYGHENSNPFEEESNTPQAFSPSTVLQTASQSDNMEASVNRSNVSIWSRRGKSKSVLIETSQSRGKSVRTGSKAKVAVHEISRTEPLETHFASPQGEVIFTPEKENHSHSTRSLMRTSGKTLPSESILNTTISRLDQDDDDDDEVFTPDKENITTNSRLLRSIKYVEEEKDQKSYRSSPLKTAVNCSMYQDNDGDDDDDEVFTPDKENITPNSRLLRSIKYVEEEKHQKSYRSSPLKTAVNCSMYQDNDGDDYDEVFTPDKENITPNSRLLRSIKYMQEGKHQKSYKRRPEQEHSAVCNMYQEDAILQSSSLLKEVQNRNILQERRSNSSSKSHATLKKTALKASADKVPFRPLSINTTTNKASSQPSSARQITSKNNRSLNCFESEEVIPRNIITLKSEIRGWNIVADTDCLLNKKSRRELQLLRGLKGTSLFIPRIVVRELDCMLKRGSLFRRTTDVSEALEWIEDCMANSQWWIHVQSSAELGMLIPPTPPASSHCCSEDTNPFNSDSVPFSSYSLQELVTPTAGDHILECALSIKRSRNDEQLVLLSNDVSMKIKAMAEGVNCETAEDFRRSLINPFSERFLYNGSSPRGPTWSCVDDTVLKEKYYPSPTKKLSKPGGVKGLKLILQHNANFKQIAF